MMPSKIIEQQGLSSPSSSSYFSNEVRFPSETQVGFWRHDVATGHYENRQPVASSALENFRPVEPHAERFLGHAKPYINSNQRVDIGLGTHTAGPARSTSNLSTLWRPSSRDISGRPGFSAQSTPYFVEGEKINMIDAQSENGLFSCSYSDLFTRKLKLSENTALLGHSVGNIAHSHYEEVEPFESLEEIEAQTIGNLLPNDDDLLSGIADGFDYAAQPGGVDDPEDLDLFCSVGGMDLSDESSCVGLRSSEDPEVIYNGQVGGSSGSIVAEHPFGEQPSRTLFVRNINSNVEDSELRALFEQYGDIRTLYTACKLRGFVMISYYDLRASQNAMRALQNQPLRRRKLDIHFSIPKGNPSEKDVNQGSLVVFNLDISVSDDEIHRIFGLYGEIKEIRDIPNRSHHRLIEFYDIRAAESAIRALNRRDISGKQINPENSLPWGSRSSTQQQYFSDIEQNESDACLWPNSSTTAFPGLVGSHTSSSTMDNETAPTLGAAHSPITPFHENNFHDGNSSGSLSSAAADITEQPGPIKFDFLGNPLFHTRSSPDYYDGLSSGGVPCKSGVNNNIISNINSSTPPKRVENKGQHFIEVFGNGGCPVAARHQYMLNNNTICPPHPPGIMWPNSPSFVNGVVPLPQSHMLRTVASLSNHHVGVGSAPSLWERQHHRYGQEAPDPSFLPASLGRVHPQPLEFGPHNAMFPNAGGMEIPKTVGLHSHHQMCLMFPGSCSMIPVMSGSSSSFEAVHSDRGRSRRNDNNPSHHDNKKQYELDIERIALGEDSRTTLMIKNIPNKYTSKMLLATIDERHRGTYDFIYLPIDFKNKCNVGYAFINMTDPSQITLFYQEFNGKKWEKFNSEKVASLAYARIQGKAALIAHFQNSSLMNEDKRCRPILFNTDGPNAGDQVPFPMGVNIRLRPGKTRTSRGSSSGESSSELD